MPHPPVETLIIGAGQAGLAMSYHLTQHGHPHLVLERGRIGERWRSERWDGMHFQSPNKLVQLPGFAIPASDPDAYATARDIADFLSAYAARIPAPVHENTAVTALRQGANGGFIAETAAGPIPAANVVVATGPFQRPFIPALVPEDSDVLQIHASAYKNAAQLPEGAVLVVGAGASGSQIAHELMRQGRRVFLSVSKHRRAPRRYRGHDHVWWWVETGMDQTPPEKRSPDTAPLVHTGAYGGQTIDFRQFAAEGMVLLGHTQSYSEGVLRFADDLAASLAHGDAAFQAFMDFVDDHIRRKGLDLPEDPEARRTVPPPPSLAVPRLELDLKAEGVRTIIWSTGYRLDFGWIEAPVLDARKMPVHTRGVTSVPGLYFLGLPFLSRMSSSFIFGVGDDAARIAEAIVGGKCQL